MTINYKLGKLFICVCAALGIAAFVLYFTNKSKCSDEKFAQTDPLSKTAYYINMDTQVSRKNHTEKLLKDIGFTTIVRQKPDLSLDPYGSSFKAHKAIWIAISKKTKEQYYFAFEDDAEIAHGVDRKAVFSIIKDDLAKIKHPDKKFIYLGACLDEKQAPKCTTNVCNAWCAHAYMLTPAGARALLKSCPKKTNNQVTDNFLLNLFSPPLIGHKFTHDHTEPDWRGLFYQARKASWYSNGMNEEV